MSELAERLAGANSDVVQASGPAEAAARLAQALYHAYDYCDWQMLAPFLHPYGRFIPLASAGNAVLGREDLLALLARAPVSGPGTVELTTLSTEAVLGVSRSLRKVEPGEQRAAARASIVTVRDGLLFRERAFASAPDAYRAYLCHGATLGI